MMQRNFAVMIYNMFELFTILLKSYNMHIYQNEFDTFVYSIYNDRNSSKYINYIHSIHTKSFHLEMTKLVSFISFILVKHLSNLLQRIYRGLIRHIGCTKYKSCLLLSLLRCEHFVGLNRE